MHIKILVPILLIISCYPNTVHGAHMNRRTKNSIQNRQARQIKAAEKIKKRCQARNKEVADKERKARIEAAIIAHKKDAPYRPWKVHYLYNYKLRLLEREVPREYISSDHLLGLIQEEESYINRTHF
ncbi:MAG: hypothetical protein ACHQVS_04170 [Candidatus Babeliales bacterium]